MRIERYRKTRYWAVVASDGSLVCLCVYRNGAQEVVKRLHALGAAQPRQDHHEPAAARRIDREDDPGS
jgi:hypothetical protein